MCMTQNMGAIFFENRGVWHKMYDTKKATNLLRKNVLQQVNNNLFRNKWRNFPAFWTIGSPWNIAVFRLEKAWSAAASNDTTISEPFCVVQQRVKQFLRGSQKYGKSHAPNVQRTHLYFVHTITLLQLNTFIYFFLLLLHLASAVSQLCFTAFMSLYQKLYFQGLQRSLKCLHHIGIFRHVSISLNWI